jgi:hypothetical protein
MEAAGGPPAAFTITAQDHQPVFNQSDPNASQWTIHFTTPTGVASFVTVDDADYTAQHVGGLIAQRVADIEAVQRLGGPG